ncbi:MAG: hypothetical protein ACREOZ_03615 [Gloeomargaritales cyanobacterium]
MMEQKLIRNRPLMVMGVDRRYRFGPAEEIAKDDVGERGTIGVRRAVEANILKDTV